MKTEKWISRIVVAGIAAQMAAWFWLVSLNN